MKGRQKLRRRLGGGSSLTVKYLRAVYCAKSAINGGEEIRIRICQKHAATLPPPQKKTREEKIGEKIVFSRCVEQMARALLPFTLSCELPTIFQPSFPSLPPSLYAPPVFLTFSQERKNGRKAEGTNAIRGSRR